MPTLNDKFYREMRCPHCHSLLGYEYVYAGRIVFKCRKCKNVVEFNFKHMKTSDNKHIINDEFSIQENQSKGGE